MRLSVRHALLALASAATLLAPAAPALAAEGYATSTWRTCNAVDTGGQYDEAGNAYVACGSSVVVVDAATGGERVVALPFPSLDVAPSPDGASLYVLDRGYVKRMARSVDGTYALDAAWKPATFVAGGKTWTPQGRNLHADGRGDIYLSNGSYSNPNMILKFAPGGALKAQFGDYTNTAEAGKFNLNRGVATTRDGRFVYVVEKTGGRVQRFDYDGATARYRYALQWGRSDTSCAAGNFSNPGDVGVDPWGFVYVMDTTCERVQKFDAAGALLYQLRIGGRSSAFSVTGAGDVYVGAGSNVRMVRTTPTPGPWPALQPLPLPPYAVQDVTMCPGETSTTGGGQAGNDGRVWIACSTSIAVSAPDGSFAGRVAVPTNATYYDVAPSPDARYLYVTRALKYDSTNPAPHGQPELVRMVRQGDTGYTYALDPAWRAADYQLAGKTWHPYGRYVATDHWGDVYVSSGGWVRHYDTTGRLVFDPAPAIVLKYAPSGTQLTQLGSYDPAIGEFDVNMGIAVSRDGRTIYTVEHVAGRVQRFDYASDGTYRQTAATKVWGTVDTTCTKNLGFAAPYDVGLDPWGYVYVISTSCAQVKKFTADGTWLSTMQTRGKVHGIAVDLHGNVYAADADQRMVRSATNPEPGPVPVPLPLEHPDTAAPTLTEVGVPAVTTTQAITITVTASDDTAVSGMRVAGEDGTWGAWRPFAASSSWTVSAGYGPKGVFVQVRDAAGNESVTLYRTLQFQPVVDTQDPVLASVTLPPTTTTSQVTVTTTVTDDTGATGMRLANEDGTWGPWIAYEPERLHTLTAGSGFRGVFVQVRDAAGHESNVVYRTTQVVLP